MKRPCLTLKRSKKQCNNILSGSYSDLSLKVELDKLLINGKYGIINVGTDKKTDERVIVKTISKIGSDKNRLKAEVSTLEKLKSNSIKFVIDMYYSIEDINSIYIIQEYCDGGDMYSLLDEIDLLPEKRTANILNNLLKTMTHCHKLGIVHRDLKPENIVFKKKRKDVNDTSGDDDFRLIDFGLAYHNINNSKIKMTSILGTSYYIAPEILTRVNGYYNESCDIWSIGVILYVSLSGTTPFYGKNYFDIIKSIKNGKYDCNGSTFKNISFDAKDLINKLLTYNPKKRININDALKHNFFTN